MSDTEIQAVDTPAPDANVIQEVEDVAAPSPAVESDDKPKGVAKRIDELTRNWREEQRRNEQLMRLLEQRDQPRQEAPKAVEEKPKTLADFEYDEGKFQAYIFEQAEKRSVEAAKRELSAAQEREAAERRRTSFKSREAEFAKTVEDYDAAWDALTRYRIPDDVAQAIKLAAEESEDGPALFYHLGKNREVTEKLAQLPPIVAARELGKIEARLAFEKERAKEAKAAVSKAPPPPPKVEAVESAVNIRPDDPESDKLPMSEWLAKREKQVARKKA